MRAIKSEVGGAIAAIAALCVLSFASGGAALGADRNACGCYKTEGGSCYCDKKAKCGCPGECEPKGCEEKRQKEIEKEIDAETKRAQSAERSQERSEKSTPAPAAEKTPSSAKAVTPAQLRELAKLLELYLAQHPDEAGKSVEGLARELARQPK
jgi:hypothetical protein